MTERSDKRSKDFPIFLEYFNYEGYTLLGWYKSRASARLAATSHANMGLVFSKFGLYDNEFCTIKNVGTYYVSGREAE